MQLIKSNALKFVILFGIISMFADMTYEGARSITGPYLAILGANGTTVGFVAGFGELLGYALRFFSGYLADRTQRYWLLTIIGYFTNLLAIPLLALVGNWPLAACLIILERTGKAIRTPAKDAMLSHATTELGSGKGFGLHEAMDQLGAMIGPLIVAVVLAEHQHYQKGFAILLIPALFALTTLFLAYRRYPNPANLEVNYPHIELEQHFTRSFWLYVIGAALVAAGFADFPLIAYHFQKAGLLSPLLIPISYALAMATSAMSALISGYYYDRYGFKILMFITFITALFAPLAFLGDETCAFVGMALWGIGIGSQSSLMKAVIANQIAANRRASAYGIFNLFFGVFWFLGSLLMGHLYDTSIIALVVFSVLLQWLALPLWILSKP